MRVAIPLLGTLVLVLTGCGASGAENSPPAAGASAVPVAQTCNQIAPDGGIGAMQEATDFAKELSEVTDYEAAMAMSDRAQQLLDTFDPIIATADDSIRADLEAVVAPPRSLVEAKESGDQSLNLEFSGFSDGGTAVLDTCFSDTEEPGATTGTTAALIGRDTAVEAYCGTLVDGYKIEAPSTDVTTFGQVWDLIADGQSCDTHDGEAYDFAFEADTDAAGNRVPREEYKAPVEKMWEGFDDAEQAEEMVTIAIDMCLYRPDHPQSEQRRELLEHLPQAQAEFDKLLEEAAKQDASASAAPTAEASSAAGGDVKITGDYAADLAAAGMVPDDVTDFRLFADQQICQVDMDDTFGPLNLKGAVSLLDPAVARVTVAYDCPELEEDVEKAIAEVAADQ